MVAKGYTKEARGISDGFGEVLLLLAALAISPLAVIRSYLGWKRGQGSEAL